MPKTLELDMSWLYRYIKEELSYLPDSIVIISNQLLQVKFKCSRGSLHTSLFMSIIYPNLLYIYQYWWWNLTSCNSTLKKNNLWGNFHVGKANNAQWVFFGNAIEFIITAQNLWINIVRSSVFECASKWSSSQIFWLSGRVNIPKCVLVLFYCSHWKKAFRNLKTCQ